MEGKLDYGEYTDKNNVRRQATTIIAGQTSPQTIHVLTAHVLCFALTVQVYQVSFVSLHR